MIVLKPRDDAPAESLHQIRLMALRFPGDVELQIVVQSGTLTIGDRVDGSDALLAALREFGEVEVLVQPLSREAWRPTASVGSASRWDMSPRANAKAALDVLRRRTIGR